MKAKYFLIFAVTLVLVGVLASSLFLSTVTSTTRQRYLIIGQAGTAFLQVPPSSASGLPVNSSLLSIYVGHFTEESSFGAMDTLFVSIWIPANKAFVTGVVVSDNPTQDNTVTKPLFNGTAVWNPPLFQNVVNVADNELEVEVKGDTLTANLTVPINVSLPFSQLPSSNPRSTWSSINFTVPPMFLRFQAVGEPFLAPSVTVIPSSGWTIDSTDMQKLALAQITMPAWLGPNPMDISGHLAVERTVAMIPPA